MKRLKIYIVVILLSLIPTFAVWTPFYLRIPEVWNIPVPSDGMQTVVANYDGPLYIVVAKSLYNKEIITQNFSFNLPYEYYAAHFPLYPLIIRLFSYLTGFAWGSLLATLVTSIFAHIYFFRFIREYVKKDSDALWMTFVFAIFPARWLIVRSVGAPEALFIGACIATLFHFKKKQYLLAGIFGAVAQLTKSPGILLLPTLFLALIFPRFRELVTTHNLTKWVKSIHLSAVFIALIPLALIAVFFSYQSTFGTFFAYFNSGDNIHLFFPPFQIFDYSQPWVGTHWLEEIIFIYLFGALGLIRLIRQKDWTLVWFVAIFFTTTLFVSHRDIMRYSLPIVPFLLAGFSKEITSRDFKFVIALLIIPIYLFTMVFIINNQMPIEDWTPFL